MKKLLSLLSILTISGTAIPTTIAVSPYQKEETINLENIEINSLQTNNLKRIKKQIDLSTYVTTTDLGIIRPGSSYGGRISDLRILNQFVRLNPNLPQELRVTSRRGGAIIHVSVNYGNRAIIEVLPFNNTYYGSVQVTFNGGQLPTWNIPNDEQTSNWHSRINLSTLQNLNRNLNNIIDTSERNIIQAFMINNQNLSNELINILRVSNITRNSARIYVPEGNIRYEGYVIVYFTVRNFNQNINIHSEFR